MENTKDRLRLLLFLSHSEKDFELFDISELSKGLESYDNIVKALYFERDSIGDFIDFMDENIRKCHVVIYFATLNALTSHFTKLEWKAALTLKKIIIPVYLENDMYIPVLLKSLIGWEYNHVGMRINIEGIYKMIMARHDEIDQVILDPFSIENDFPSLTESPRASQIATRKFLESTFRGNPIHPEHLRVILELQLIIKKTLELHEKITDRSEAGVTLNEKYVEGLSLNKCRINIFPDSIKNFNTLKFLNINNNQLKQLSNSISELSQLQFLYLKNNRLKEIPSTLNDLNNLVELYFSNNQISSLPESLGNIKSLEILYLNNNYLEVIPGSIGNLESLKSLDLSNNILKSIPTNIGKLKNLEYLNLNNNQLEYIPNSIVELTSLRHLNLNKNPLSEIPEFISEIRERGTIVII